MQELSVCWVAVRLCEQIKLDKPSVKKVHARLTVVCFTFPMAFLW